MITKALQYTVHALNQYLEMRMGVESGFAIMNKLVNSDGSSVDANRNRVVISLINLEKETARPFYNRTQERSQQYADMQPSIRLNVDMLVTSSFDDYSESISFLNSVIGFFQVNPVLDAAHSADFPEGLGRLEFEMEKITYHQMHSLWTSMGAKYQPSVIYKIRLITVQGNEVKGFTPAVSQINNGAGE